MAKYRLKASNYLVLEETETALIVFDKSTYRKKVLQKEIEVDFVYMKVTNDEYEYPLVIADSIAELSKIVGVGRQVIHRSIKIQNGKYKKVDLREV